MIQYRFGLFFGAATVVGVFLASNIIGSTSWFSLVLSPDCSRMELALWRALTASKAGLGSL